MNQIFWKEIQSQSGYLAVVVDSKTHFGEKAFLNGIHPLVENQASQEFWDNFFDSLPKQNTLPTIITTADGSQIFLEKLHQKPKLVILGGGHVSLSVYTLGIMLGFDVTIVDDREEFCNMERFPLASQCICKEFEQAMHEVPSGKGVYYVIVTRGHKCDKLCVKHILKKQYSYVGMIGSRRKVALVKESLESAGFSPQQIDSIFTPIGIDIGAQTPEEIAISIMAEIIHQKNRQGSDSYSDDDAVKLISNSNNPITLCLIIKKTGSIPRTAGSKMAVESNGNSVGSIGGGKIEFDACNEALSLCKSLDTKPRLRTFHMDAASAESDGMVCGGSAVVYLETMIPG